MHRLAHRDEFFPHLDAGLKSAVDLTMQNSNPLQHFQFENHHSQPLQIDLN